MHYIAFTHNRRGGRGLELHIYKWRQTPSSHVGVTQVQGDSVTEMVAIVRDYLVTNGQTDIDSIVIQHRVRFDQVPS